jgi:arginyl-tRNA synthetase
LLALIPHGDVRSDLVEKQLSRKARIELVDAFRTTLRNSLSLLGIGTLERI